MNCLKYLQFKSKPTVLFFACDQNGSFRSLLCEMQSADQDQQQQTGLGPSEKHRTASPFLRPTKLEAPCPAGLGKQALRWRGYIQHGTFSSVCFTGPCGPASPHHPNEQDKSRTKFNSATLSATCGTSGDALHFPAWSSHFQNVDNILSPDAAKWDILEIMAVCPV